MASLVRMSENLEDRFRFDPFEADLHTHELWKGGIRIKLLGQPFEILAVLLSKPGQLVTREELRARLWPADTFVDFNHGLNAAMNKLRDALCDSADNPRYIETLPRRGYRFIATVKWVQGREDTNIAGSESAQVTKLPIAAPEGKSAADTISIANAVPESSPIRHKRRFSTVQITLILLSIAALGYFTWFYRWQNSRAPKIGRRTRSHLFLSQTLLIPPVTRRSRLTALALLSGDKVTHPKVPEFSLRRSAAISWCN